MWLEEIIIIGLGVLSETPLSFHGDLISLETAQHCIFHLKNTGIEIVKHLKNIHFEKD